MSVTNTKFDAAEMLATANPLATVLGQGGATGLTAKAPSVDTAGPAPTTPSNAFSMKGLS